MNLTEAYLENYDYYGNAAEDTLIFFVRDESVPAAESFLPGDETITNQSVDTVNGESNGSLSGQPMPATGDGNPVGTDDKDASGRAPSLIPDPQSGDATLTDSFPKMQPVDEKQTDLKTGSGTTA